MHPIREPVRSGLLQVSAIHQIYWEESGNPDGIPVIFLHGGPGAGASPACRGFFNPEKYRIVIIDRGRPVASGSVDEIRSLAEGTTVTATWAGLTGEAELHRVLSPVAGSLLEVEVHGSHVTVRTTAPDDVARLLLTATPATRLGITALSLEEVFSRLVGTHRAENPAASRTA